LLFVAIAILACPAAGHISYLVIEKTSQKFLRGKIKDV